MFAASLMPAVCCPRHIVEFKLDHGIYSIVIVHNLLVRFYLKGTDRSALESVYFRCLPSKSMLYLLFELMCSDGGTQRRAGVQCTAGCILCWHDNKS